MGFFVNQCSYAGSELVSRDNKAACHCEKELSSKPHTQLVHLCFAKKVLWRNCHSGKVVGQQLINFPCSLALSASSRAVASYLSVCHRPEPAVPRAIQERCQLPESLPQLLFFRSRVSSTDKRQTVSSPHHSTKLVKINTAVACRGICTVLIASSFPRVFLVAMLFPLTVFFFFFKKPRWHFFSHEKKKSISFQTRTREKWTTCHLSLLWWSFLVLSLLWCPCPDSALLLWVLCWWSDHLRSRRTSQRQLVILQWHETDLHVLVQRDFYFGKLLVFRVPCVFRDKRFLGEVFWKHDERGLASPKFCLRLLFHKTKMPLASVCRWQLSALDVVPGHSYTEGTTWSEALISRQRDNVPHNVNLENNLALPSPNSLTVHQKCVWEDIMQCDKSICTFTEAIFST